MARHRKIRNWLLTLPAAALALLALPLGSSIAHYAAGGPQASPAAVSVPSHQELPSESFRKPFAVLSPVQGIVTVTVTSGDTLSGIAGKYCGSPLDYPALATANHLSPGDVLPVGKILVIGCHGK